MHMFSERTQVLLSKQQLATLKRRAKRDQSSVGAVIRAAVDSYLEIPSNDERQAALQRLFALNAPVDDWPVMKAQIEENMLREIEQSMAYEESEFEIGCQRFLTLPSSCMPAAVNTRFGFLASTCSNRQRTRSWKQRPQPKSSRRSSIGSSPSIVQRLGFRWRAKP